MLANNKLVYKLRLVLEEHMENAMRGVEAGLFPNLENRVLGVRPGAVFFDGALHQGVCQIYNNMRWDDYLELLRSQGLLYYKQLVLARDALYPEGGWVIEQHDYVANDAIFDRLAEIHGGEIIMRVTE